MGAWTTATRTRTPATSTVATRRRRARTGRREEQLVGECPSLTQRKQELEEEAKRADKRAFDEEPEPEVKKKGGGGPLAKKSRH